MKTHKNFLVTNSSVVYGGGEYFVLELSRTLQSRGYNVVVGGKAGSLLVEKCRQSNLKVLALDYPPQGQFLKYVRLFQSIIHDYNIDLVHTNSNFDRTACAFAAKLKGIGHVANVHSFHSLRRNITHWIRNKYAIDQFIVDGHCVKEMMVKEDGIRENKISVVHLGVNPEIMKKDPSARARIRKEFCIDENDIVIGNVARMTPFKGHEYLLKAYAIIAQKVPSAKLFLVGDGELTPDIKKLAGELKLSDKVIFAGFRDDLTAVYSAFDIYVHSSIEGGGETFPFAVVQALSQELPVVVTRVGDVPFMVEKNFNGFVTPEKDARALAEKLLFLIQNPDQRHTMAANSRKHLLKNFTLDRMMDRIEEIYRQAP